MGINNNIKITNLSERTQEILSRYSKDITEKVKDLAKDVTIELTQNTKRDSPVLTGEYKKHITYKLAKETMTHAVYIWYVKDPEYRLTHLLAREHAKKNGGRVKGNEYLRKNVSLAQNKFVKGVKEIINNGC